MVYIVQLVLWYKYLLKDLPRMVMTSISDACFQIVFMNSKDPVPRMLHMQSQLNPPPRFGEKSG